MLKFIGEIKTPYNSLDECPRNINREGPSCSLILKDIYQEGLEGLQAGDKILVLYWLDYKDSEDAEASQMTQTSLDSGVKKGVFSLRSPHRPNPIGVAVVRVENINKNIVNIRGLDCLNGTKLLDIKPAIMDECS